MVKVGCNPSPLLCGLLTETHTVGVDIQLYDREAQEHRVFVILDGKKSATETHQVEGDGLDWVYNRVLDPLVDATCNHSLPACRPLTERHQLLAISDRNAAGSGAY